MAAAWDYLSEEELVYVDKMELEQLFQIMH